MTQRQDYETMSQQDTRFWLIKEPNFNSATFLTVLRDSLLSSRLPTYVLTMHLQCKPFLLIFRSLVLLSLTLPMVSDPLPKVPPFQGEGLVFSCRLILNKNKSFFKKDIIINAI